MVNVPGQKIRMSSAVWGETDRLSESANWRQNLFPPPNALKVSHISRKDWGKQHKKPIYETKYKYLNVTIFIYALSFFYKKMH